MNGSFDLIAFWDVIHNIPNMHLKNTVQAGEGPSWPAEPEQPELAGERDSGEGLLWVCQTMLSVLTGLFHLASMEENIPQGCSSTTNLCFTVCFYPLPYQFVFFHL